jgi:hypothetical protein
LTGYTFNSIILSIEIKNEKQDEEGGKLLGFVEDAAKLNINFAKGRRTEYLDMVAISEVGGI